MRASTAAAIGLALFGSLALGAFHLLTEGALFSRPHHEWRIDVAADGDEPWSLEVPTLAATGASADELDALLERLRVADGDARFERNGTSLRIDGRGDASLVAHRAFWGMRSAPFSDWHATGNASTRLDADGPAEVLVTWSLDLVAGGGHTCGGNGAWSARLAPGAHEPLTEPAMTPTGETRVPLTTAAPPVRMWCH